MLEESVHFFIKNQPNYPKCEIKEYINIKNKLNKSTYKSVNSNEQIKTIMKLSKRYKLRDYSDRLMNLFYIHFRRTKGLYKLLNSNKSDSEIYNILKSNTKIFRSKKSLKKYNRPDLPCDRYVKDTQIINYIIRTHAVPKLKIKNYLDIGCGDCIKTKLLGDMLGLNSKQIYGADILEWSSYTEQERKQLSINIIDLKPNKPLPIKSNKFSLVSVYMVLHHVKKLKLMLNEIHRILKPNGYLIIKEHDAITSLDCMLADVEHAIYGIIYGKYNYKNFIKDHYANYHDWLEWNLILHKHGFDYIYSKHIYSLISQKFKPTRGYIAMYKKIS